MNIYALCGNSQHEQWRNVVPSDDNTIDDIIYSNLPVVVFPDKNSINFLISYLAEWRLLNKHESIKKRKIIIYNHQSFFDPLLECLRSYRSNLPDEKNEQAVRWFVYPNTKLQDIFLVFDNIDEIKSKIDEYSNKEFFSVKPKNSKDNTTIKKTKGNKYIFVPASAFGWTMYDDLAFKLGQHIANCGHRFINGGPDGGRLCNGPMRQSALGFIDQSKDNLIVVYSELIFKNYVKTEQLDVFKSQIDIIYCGTESERKSVMIDGADLVYALPGAIGTWAEVTHSLVLGKTVKLFGDYWKDFKKCLDHYSFNVEWSDMID